MELKGNLDSNSLQEIFTTLARNKQIGTLIVSDGESKKYIYFARAGVRLLSSGKRKAVPLGDLLVKLNKITGEQLKTVLERQKETSEMMGKILTDWGLVTEEEIDEAVRSQIEEEIFDIFSWDNATFEFTEGAPPKELFDPNQRATRLTFDVMTLVQEGNKRVQDMKEIKKILPPLDAVYALGEFTELEFYEKDDSDSTKKVVLKIDGVRPIREVLDEVDLPKIEVARIIAELVTQKKIEKVEKLPGTGAQTEEAKSDLESFITKCEREIFNDPDNYGLRERLAQAYYDMGDLEKAVLHLNLVSKAQLKDGQVDKALATTKRIVEVVPEDPEIRERLLHVYLEMRSIPEALDEASILAKIYTEAGEKEKVRNMYKLVLELVPDDIDMRKKLINVHIDLGDRDAAAQEYEEIARIVQERGERHKLEEIYLKILRLAPHRTDIKKKLGSMKAKPTIVIPRSRFSILGKLFKWAIALAVLGAIGYAGWHEWEARKDASPRIQTVKALMSDGKFEEARIQVGEIKKRHPYTVLNYLDLENLTKEVDLAERKLRQDEDDKKRSEEKRDYEAYSGVIEKEESIAKNISIRPQERVETLKALHEAMSKLAESNHSNEWVAKAREWIVKWNSRKVSAKALLDQALAFEAGSNVVDGRKARLELREKYGDTEFALNLQFPYIIQSAPSEAAVSIRGVRKGSTPLLLYEPLDTEEVIEVLLEKDGYLPHMDSIYDIKGKAEFRYVLKRKPLWKIQTESPINSAPVIDGEMLYFGSRDGFLYAVRTESINPRDETTWNPAWKFKNAQRQDKIWEILCSPVVRDGYVFFGSTDNHVYAVRNNRELWHFDAGGIIEFPPVLLGNILLFSCNISRAGRVCALEIKPDDSAITRWIYPQGDVKIRKAVTGPAAYPEQNVVFFGDAWGDVHAIDAQNGRQITVFNTKLSIETQLLVCNDALFFVGSDKAVHAWDVSEIKKKRAEELWSYQLADATTVAPVQFAGSLITVTKSGHVAVLDVRNPRKYQENWKYKIEGEIAAPPAFSDTDVLIGGFDKNLYAFNLSEGKLDWCFETPGRIRGIAVRKGVVFCTCEEGLVFAISEK